MRPGEAREIGRIEAGPYAWVAERIEGYNPRKPRWRVTEAARHSHTGSVRLVCYCGTRGEALREIELRAAMRRRLEAMKAEGRECGCQL